MALCVAGGIAAYKAPVVARLLLARGVRVLPVMTRSAQRFVGAVTLSGICGEPVRDDMWDPSFAGELHVSLAAEADVVAMVPATADLLARLAEGRADDLVTALALVARGPLIVAPAMHPRMWAHPAVQRNAARLVADGRAQLVGPVFGAVASGEEGVGRMSEPEDIVEAIVAALASTMRDDLRGLHIVVSAGPTLEDLDPVRFLGNRSTGKMGFAVAERAGARGARVSLVTGPVSLATPPSVNRIDVRSALEMEAAITHAMGDADALVMAAAVADHRPATVGAEKTKKQGDSWTITLVENPDILAGVGLRRGDEKRPVLVGFAVETTNLEAYARKKRAEKRVDLVIGNLAAHGFGGDADEVIFVDDGPPRPLKGPKTLIADAILDEVRARLP